MTDIEGALEQGKTVAVHCRQSVGRAGLIAAGVLIASGATPDDAIETVSASRGLPIPETREQLAWLRRLSSPQIAASSSALTDGIL